MMFLRFLLPGLVKLLPAAKDLAEVFVGNRKERDRNAFDEQISLHKEQASEFTYKVKNRTWWDGFVDGINRLPRPLFSFMVAGMFLWAVFDPARFSVSMRAIDTIPQSLWGIVALVLGFFFGGRLITSDIAKNGAVKRDRAAAQQYFDERERSAPKPSSGGAKAIAEDWRTKSMDRG